MVEFCPMSFGEIWRRFEEALMRRVDQMEISSIVRGRERSKRKFIGKIIKRDLDFNNLNINTIYD